MQKETGLALVFFAFFLVMYREGLPSAVLIIGFAVAALVVATLLLEKNTLALYLPALLYWLFIYAAADKKRRSVLLKIVLLGLLCVGIQRFGVPFIFKNLLAKHQVERIYSTIGRDVPQ